MDHFNFTPDRLGGAKVAHENSNPEVCDSHTAFFSGVEVLLA